MDLRNRAVAQLDVASPIDELRLALNVEIGCGGFEHEAIFLLLKQLEEAMWRSKVKDIRDIPDPLTPKFKELKPEKCPKVEIGSKGWLRDFKRQ